jgi:DNA repair protein RecO (recombination protein O)
MSVYRTEGIILKRSDVGEADRILSILSRDRGIVKTIARASRLPLSKLGCFLDLYSHVDIALAEGKTFDVVTEVKTIDAFSSLRTNVLHNMYASHIAELVIRASHGGDSGSPGLFELVLETYTFLNTAAPALLVLPSFRLKFLSLFGYALELYECASCHEKLKNTTNYLSPTYDGILCETCHQKTQKQFETGSTPLSANSLKLLRLLVGSDYQRLAKVHVPEKIRHDIESLSELLVRYHLEIPLKSTVVVQSIPLRKAKKSVSAGDL